jgi:hypothetical protein
VIEGTRIIYGTEPYECFFQANDYEDLLEHFEGKTVKCGTSRTNPPQGSLGKWLQTNVCKTALASYVAPVLMKELYAKKKRKPF